MLEKLKDAKKAVGTRRLLKALERGEVLEAFLAADADLFIVRQVKKACADAGVRMPEVPTMKELGAACGVDVKTASAGILK